LASGNIDWAIPVAWGELSSTGLDDCVGTLGTVYHQVFAIDASGMLRVDKFSQWIQCTADGHVTHSSGIR